MINIDHNPVETEDGVWTPPYEEVEFLVAHVSSMKFQKKLARLQQPYSKQIEAKRLDPEIQKKILCMAMAGTLLLGWRGKMVDNSGATVDFSEQRAFNLLMNAVDVREFVTGWAGDLDNYRKQETEELGKL